VQAYCGKLKDLDEILTDDEDGAEPREIELTSKQEELAWTLLAGGVLGAPAEP
jgi:hypothetical protein